MNHVDCTQMYFQLDTSIGHQSHALWTPIEVPLCIFTFKRRRKRKKAHRRWLFNVQFISWKRQKSYKLLESILHLVTILSNSFSLGPSCYIHTHNVCVSLTCHSTSKLSCFHTCIRDIFFSFFICVTLVVIISYPHGLLLLLILDYHHCWCYAKKNCVFISY